MTNLRPFITPSLVALLACGLSWGQTGAIVRFQTGHTAQEWIPSVAFSPDGRRVVTGGRDDRNAIIWDFQSGNEIHRFADRLKRSFEINLADRGEASVFSADGGAVLTGNWSGEATLWDALSGSTIRRFEARRDLDSSNEQIVGVALSHDRKLAVTVGGAVGATLWDVSSGKSLRSFASGGTAPAFSPSDKTLFLSGDASLWDVASGRKLRTFGKNVRAAAMTPDGRLVFSVSDSRTLDVWDALDGRNLHHFESFPEVHERFYSFSDVRELAVSSHGMLFATLDATDTVRLWSENGREIRKVVKLPFAGKTALAFSADDKYLAVTDRGSVHIYETDTGFEVRRLAGKTSGLDGVDRPSQDEKNSRLIVKIHDTERGPETWTDCKGHYEQNPATWSDCNLYQLGPDTWTDWDLFGDVSVGNTMVGDIEKPTEDKDLAAKLRSSNQALVSRSDGGVALTLTSQDGFVVQRRWSGDTLLIRNSESGEVGLRSASSDEALRPVDVPRDVLEVRGAFSEDSKLLVVGYEREARIVDSNTGRTIHVLGGLQDEVSEVGFRCNGRLAFVASRDGTIRIWNVKTGASLVTLVIFRAGGWAVIDSEGHYDALNPDAEAGLYGQDGDKVFPVGQLKDRWYVPQLLQKRLGPSVE